MTSITTILVKLHIDGEASLFILLAKDGTINRLGTGTANNTDNDVFIGLSDLSVFKQVRKLAKPVLDNRIGGYAAPEISGKQCELVIIFETTDGEQLTSRWKYGTQSQGPPPDVTHFVIGAVKATNSWWEEQKAMAASAD